MRATLRATALVAALFLGHQGAASAQGGHGTHTERPPFVISSEMPFATLMDQAMVRMHEDMMAAPASGNHDHDFLAMMIPHHQGAIDMAKIVLLRTQDPRIRNLAQSIITEQQYEIELMRSMLATGPAGRSPSPDQEIRR